MTDLDEFQLLRPLGKGGMGVVYLAHDTVLDRQVAIKLIGSNNPDATSRERLLTEARAIARLSHPNVVSIYRVGTTTDGRPYLVQELVAGTSLDRVHRPIGWRRVCELALGIARGLATAHRRGILHRDIKPGNVMLDERGTVRILDFGLAKLSGAPPPHASNQISVTDPRVDRSVDPDATLDPVSTTGIPSAPTLDDSLQRAPSGTPRSIHGGLVGTPRYLAPELWRGEPATVRSDLYALGVMLFELLSGDPPFAQQDLAALESAVTTTDARSVAAASRDVPAWLATLIDRCLSRDPAVRPESADELAYAIEQGLAGGPPIPEGNPYRGLERFDASHRGVFFGRGADVEHIVDKLRSESMLAITGDSGTGKSSLCRAGVLPAILDGALDDRRWRAITLSPGPRPFAALCSALSTAETGTVAERARDVVPAPDEGLVVFVDQCEELITIADRDQADPAAELLAALADGYPNVRVLLAVRGDFLTRVATLPALAVPLSRGLHLLRPLSARDIREAIVGPARLKGVRFETDAMIDELVRSVGDAPGTLPLLQFALAELWDARGDGDSIRASALADIGGVAGALARHADRVMLSLGEREREAARRILLRLVTADGTRVAGRTTELVDGKTAETALESLVRGRLVIARDTTDVPAYELAHEALIASWSTLRGWLDDQAGHRAMLERVTAAAATWRTDGRRDDLLWSKRQVDAAERVPDLGDGELEFLAASKRHHRRARRVRTTAVAAVPIVAIATWLVLRANAHANLEREIDGRLQTAGDLRGVAEYEASIAATARSQAFAAFDARDRDQGEDAWARARTATANARTAYRNATAELEKALPLEPDNGPLRAAMATLLAAHATVAEAARDRDGVADLISRLEAYDRMRAAHWNAPARLTVTSGATTAIAIAPIVEQHGRATVAAARARGVGTVSEQLAAGSYIIELTGSDGHVVRAPILLSRGQERSVSIEVPPRTSVPDGFIYIPAGDFLIGSDQDDFMRRNFLSAVPMHEVHSDAYLIGRHEVTFGEWIAYLDALDPVERAKRTPATRGGSRMVGRLERDDDVWVLSLQPADVEYRARRNEPLRIPDRDRRATVAWERTPVFGIDLSDTKAYAAWLRDTGRVPGARLCTEREWERAARGADGRPYPHGSAVDADDANLDFTYGRKPLAYGPDEVGAHPASNSSFGVSDMLGNVWEWVAGDDKPQTRGGGWYHGMVSGMSTNRDSADPAMRELTTGLRLCANPAR